MPDKKSLLDDLKIVEDKEPKHTEPKGPNNHKLAKKIAFGTVGLAALAGLGVGVINHNQDNDKQKDNDANKKATVDDKQEDPYQNLSKSKAEQVKKADAAVENIFTSYYKAKDHDEKLSQTVIASRPNTYVAPSVIKAEAKATTAIAEIKGNDTDTKDIRRAYTDVINVVKDSSLINMQTVRSHIADLKDSKLATHMEKEYEQAMVALVVTHTDYSESQVLDMTKPLSDKKLKAAQDKAAASSASASSAHAAEASNVAKAVSSSQVTSSTSSTSATKASTNATQTTTPAKSTTSTYHAAASSTYHAAASSTYHAPAQSTTQHASTQQTYHAAASSTYHAPAQSSTQHTTTQSSTHTTTQSSAHSNSVYTAPSSSIQKGNINGNNAGNGHELSGDNW